MQETGGIRVASFWARRARRLLPALVLLLLVVAFATWLFATFSERSSLRGDLLWTTGYLANWHFIATSSYFVATGVESPLQHLVPGDQEQCSSDARTSVCDEWVRFQIDHYDDITARWNAMLGRYARRHPDQAVFVSITDMICSADEAPCDDRIDGVAARPDGTHYEGEGEQKIVSVLASTIASLLDGDRA